MLYTLTIRNKETGSYIVVKFSEIDQMTEVIEHYKKTNRKSIVAACYDNKVVSNY